MYERSCLQERDGFICISLQVCKKIIQSCEVETAGRNLRASFECKCPDFMKKTKRKKKNRKEKAFLPSQAEPAPELQASEQRQKEKESQFSGSFL